MPEPIPRLNAALEGRYQVERELGEGGMASIALDEWRWQTPQAWDDDRMIISHSHRPGRGVFGGLWSLPIGGDEPVLLHDLGEACGAPSVVSRDASGDRLGCVYRQLSSNIWMVENFDPESGR